MDNVWRRLAEITWPSVNIMRQGDCIVRDNEGFGGSRANSVEAITDEPHIGEKFKRYIIWPGDQKFAIKLGSMGYSSDDHATVFQVDPTMMQIDAGCKISDEMSEELGRFFVQTDVNSSKVDIMHGSSVGKLFVTYEDAGSIVGAMYGGFKDGRAWIYSLVVTPGMRRKGIARRILQTMCGALAANEVRDVALSVLPSNLGAIKLYQSLGFVETSRYYFLERSDEQCG